MGELNNSLGTHMVTKEVFIGYMGTHNDISITYRYRESPLGDFPIIFSNIFYVLKEWERALISYYILGLDFKLTIKERISNLKLYFEIFRVDLCSLTRRSL